MNYEETPEFKKDFKKLKKRYRSLTEDLNTVKKAVIELNHMHQIDNLSTFEIPGYRQSNLSFWKIKKFACKALKGRGVKSGMRVIYAYEKFEKEENKVSLIEIYFKGDKKNEDRERIKNFSSDVNMSDEEIPSPNS